MANLLRATPLFAIHGAALDVETTGLDVRRARMIEIAVIHLDRGSLDGANAFHSLIATDTPIPAAASAVHGLDSAALADAPDFATLHDGVARFLAGRVVIGHTIGFDIAMLRQETERIGLPFEAPLSLDIRLLAQFAEPGLPSYSLEALGSWLGLPPQERHRALGDAKAAGLIFLALAPRLRERGIRTVGEAIAASRRVADAMAGAAPAAWDLPPSGQPGDPLPRLDSYPYRHRVREVMREEPVVLTPQTTLAEVLAIMTQDRLSSVFVGRPDAALGDMGILTERDVLRAIASGGAAALEHPADTCATRPLIAVPADAFLYRAIGRMSRHGIRHLAVTGEDNALVGVVTTRALLQLRSSAAVALGDEIDNAPDVPALAIAWARLPVVARALLAEDVPARTIAAIIAREIGALTRRAAILAEVELAGSEAGPVPCPYAILVLGSAGRGESLLAMDQDNAIVFAEGEPDGPADRWFAALGRRMTRILDEVGVPLCKGGVMVSEPGFRGSLATWRRRIGQWLSRSSPKDLLNADIVFDFVPVHGDLAMAECLWQEAWSAARGQAAFLKLLAESAGEPAQGLGLLGGIRTDGDGRIDLKRNGLKDIVATARLLALHQGAARRATQERLAALVAADSGGSEDLAAIADDHALLLSAILRQQLADIEAGQVPTNRLAPGILGRRQQRELKQALGRLAILPDLQRSRLGG